ncbi:hypothetical protein KC573_03515, partial [candidate division WWE3 bacterium]|nr:hypothetical protein [candidate division WWE3 bacterium]
QLHINTCDPNFQLYDDEGSAILTRVASSPFTDYGTVTSELNCIDCDENPTTSEFPCGIRMIAEQISGDCGCFIDKPLSFYGRKLTVLPFGEGWKNKPWRVAEVQAMELPAGFGSMIQWLEYQTLPEGRGRRYDRSNINKGWANLPGKKARVRNAVTAKCDANYCSYYFKNLIEKTKLNNEFGVITIHSNVHIPNTDTTTVGAWEDFFDALIGFNPSCKVIGTVACDTSLGSCPTPSPGTPSPTPSPTEAPTPTPTEAPTPSPA